MDHHADTYFIRHRANLREEVDQVLLQAFARDAFVTIELFLELLQSERLLRTR